MTTLAELRALPPGWNGHGSAAIEEAALRTASALTFVPRPGGGIVVELHAGGVDVEIDIEADGKIEDVFVGGVDVTRRGGSPGGGAAEA